MTTIAIATITFDDIDQIGVEGKKLIEEAIRRLGLERAFCCASRNYIKVVAGNGADGELTADKVAELRSLDLGQVSNRDFDPSSAMTTHSRSGMDGHS